MGRIQKRSAGLFVILAVMIISCVCCTGKESEKKENIEDKWLQSANLEAQESPEELYKKALGEDILIVYTVSTRIAEVKDYFEADYPGLSVEVRDIRSTNLVEEVEKNYKNGGSDCDVVLCNDNSGDYKTKLLDTGIVVQYIPWDIKEHMKEGLTDGIYSFVNEAEILFYNSSKYESSPIKNIWELTDTKYSGKIYMPNPLRSFSTYAFCVSLFQHEEEMKKAYEEYYGTTYTDTQQDAVTYFFTELAKNTVFTNSSDQVVEALGNGNADFGIAVSSKLRLSDVGYKMQPVYNLNPYSGCRTSVSVSMARNSKNVNTAKLFIRYLLGERDGKGRGYLPFSTLGTWSARDDVEDANPVPIKDIDLMIPDQDYLISEREKMEEFWTKLIAE